MSGGSWFRGFAGTDMTEKKDLKNRVRARQAKTGESYTAARAHVLRARPSAGGATRTCFVRKCNEKSLRVRFVDEDEDVTLRCSSYDAWRVAPGQFVSLRVTKRWTWRSDAYATGEIERHWTDIPALGLEPLKLREQGVWDLRPYEPFVAPHPYAKMWEFFASTPRNSFEFESIAWTAGVEFDHRDSESCLVVEATEIRPSDPAYARELLMRAVCSDLRCIDAHAHLGLFVLDHDPQYALRHLEIAVALGDLTVGPEFSGTLPWGHLYNRPFLRALDGYGRCLWILGRTDEALRVFERVLSLNPPDNQGVRDYWYGIRCGRSYQAVERERFAPDGPLHA